MTLALYGLGVSRGVAIGKAYVLSRDEINVAEYVIEKNNIEQEIQRFKKAIDQAEQELHKVLKQLPESTQDNIRSFITTHLLMLEDDALAHIPVDIIRERACNAEWALKLQRDALVSVFNQMNDDYLRTRRDDVDFVVNRVLRILLKQKDHATDLTSGSLQGRIVLADDLSPAEIVLMKNKNIAAFVTEYGGTTSHTAILARSLGIPALVGVHNARATLISGEELIIDGQQGVVLADADQDLITFYYALCSKQKGLVHQLRQLKSQPAISQDGIKIILRANVELPEDFPAVREVKADGVGLYRTEMLYMNSDTLPTEEQQLAIYRQLVDAADDEPVVIRTLDLGGEKSVASIQQNEVIINPALSLRGLRLCLKEIPIFRNQLRAILRASAYGQVRLMVPMLSTVHELSQVKALLVDIKKELTKEGHDFSDSLPVGGMIEVPAVALAANVFARHLDFMSIGTNDLIQYAVAADRIDDSVNYLYDPLHIGVLRLIHTVIEAGKETDTPVSMCGEMAGDVRYTRLLLGLGLREFSMHPASLLEVKQHIQNSDVEQLRQQVVEVLEHGEHSAIHELMFNMNDV
ncbi:Phosphoenolpyruvate-protein phosphotransferase of PTS system [hydrothermal vent metagenome]|uniref:Phosphoenolpyruvate-protein phosphotransferase n=1 Tax=hydrothermal vent metagenome TaxID=652676 RepID=A0A3B0ZH32_9ZZZZ